MAFRSISCGRSTSDIVYWSYPSWVPLWAISNRRWRLSRYSVSRRNLLLVHRSGSVDWSATSAREYFKQGSLARLNTTTHAEGCTPNDWPGPGGSGQRLPGICRVAAPGRSIDSSGGGSSAEACWRQRSTLKLTPGWAPRHSRDVIPLRSEPVKVGWLGQMRRETSSVCFACPLILMWPVCTRTATKSESSVYTSVPHSCCILTCLVSTPRYFAGRSTSISAFIFLESCGMTTFGW
mmetsp:Transcript_39444/g.90614  ORF Transcript_39444/g.90614 Transcript_39444/m.90614 type:complete len:236 (+) Transcript_39444:363-1070(+)